MRAMQLAVLLPALAGCLALCCAAAAQQRGGAASASQTAGARVYSGFLRYNANCNRCHGPDGAGSAIAPSLIDGLPDIETFRHIVRNGTGYGTFMMKGFGGDPNVTPYIDDIYAYLQKRASGALGRGRPMKSER